MSLQNIILSHWKLRNSSKYAHKFNDYFYESEKGIKWITLGTQSQVKFKMVTRNGRISKFKVNALIGNFLQN